MNPKLTANISQLAIITKRDRATIAKRLATCPHEMKAKAKYYALEDAIPLIFADFDSKAVKADLLAEKLKNEKIRSEMGQLELDILNGKYAKIDDVIKCVEKEYTYVRAGILSLPTRSARLLLYKQDPAEVDSVLSDVVNEILTNLSSTDKFTETVMKDQNEA